MKKFSTLLLLLLVSLLGGVNASAAVDSKWKNMYVSSISEAVTSLNGLQDGFYILRNVGRKTFLNERSDNTLWLNDIVNQSDAFENLQTAVVGMDKSVMSYVVHVSKNSGTDTNYYTMQFQSGRYLGASLLGGSAESSKETAGNVEIVYVQDNQFNFRPTGSNWANGNGTNGSPYTSGTFTGWGTSQPGADGNGAYQFYPVQLEVKPTISCTFTAKVGKTTLATVTVDCTSGQEVTNPFEASYFYTNPTFAETDLVATADNNTFTINYTEETAPFEFSSAAAPVWYNIYFRNNSGNNAIVLSSSATNVTTGKNNQALDPFTAEYLNGKSGYDSFKGGLWAFVKDGLGVKVLNKLTGNYLTFADGENSTKATLGNGTVLTVRTSTYNGGAGFSLHYPGNTDAYVGDHNADNLALWKPNGAADSQNDGGSCFQLVPATSEDIVNVGKEVLSTTLEGLTAVEEDATCATALIETAIARAKSAAEAATTVSALDVALSIAYTPVFEDGAFYLIKNCNLGDNDRAYLSTDHMFVGPEGTLDYAYNHLTGLNRNILRVTNNAPLAPRLWQFVENAGWNTYKVKNGNTGCRMSSYVEPIDMPINVNAGGDYSFKVVPSASFSGNDGKTMCQMLVGGRRINAFQGNSNNVIRDYVGNHDGDKGNYWQFIKVTEIPVTISATAGWASVALPCAVQVPAEEGLKAYYAKSVNGDRMQLAEVPNGIVPANQGFLLAKEGGAEVNLQVLTSTDATLEGNLLQPATAKRAGFDAESTYVLAKDGDDVAFLVSTLTTVPANKAYLNASDAVSQASVLSFSFGDATGINDAVSADAENETYYDLNGRVVLYPQHGIFVTSKGQKVLIK